MVRSKRSGDQAAKTISLFFLSPCPLANKHDKSIDFIDVKIGKVCEHALRYISVGFRILR